MFRQKEENFIKLKFPCYTNGGSLKGKDAIWLLLPPSFKKWVVEILFCSKIDDNLAEHVIEYNLEIFEEEESVVYYCCCCCYTYVYIHTCICMYVGPAVGEKNYCSKLTKLQGNFFC